MRYKYLGNIDYSAKTVYSCLDAEQRFGEIFLREERKMQNLKRVLALALAFVFALALVPAASALDFTDSDDIRNKEAVELLTSLGIIEGHDDGSFDPNGNLIRAEAAKIIYVAINGEDDGAKLFAGTPLFNDVDNGSWATGYINWASVMDLVAGAGDGRFRPNDLVTGYEFLKMLLTAMGYDQAAEEFVGENWQYNVLTAAIRHGLTVGFEGDLAKPLSRDNAALFAANAIYASTVSYDANMRPVSTGISFGEAHLGMKTISGVLVANTEAAIEGESITEKGSIISVEGKTVLVPAESTRELIGSAVTVLVSVKPGSTLVGTDGSFNSAAISKAFGAIKVDAEMNSLLDLEDEKVKFEEDAVYYVNYDASTSEVVAELGAGHTVRAISNDGDAEIDIVIVERLSFSEVTKVSSTGTVTVGGSKYDEENAVGIEGLEEGDKVVWFTIKNGKTVIDRAESFVGTATGYTSDYILIDGDKYETATGVSGFEPKDAPLDTETTFYFYNGMILASEDAAEETEANYALVLRATKLGWEWQAEIMDSTGETKTYTVANPEYVVEDDAIAFGLYDLTVDEDGEAKLSPIDTEGDVVTEAFSYEHNRAKFGEKYVGSNTLMFLEIEDEWKVFKGIGSIPSFEADESERTVFTVLGDRFGTNDGIDVAVIPNVTLSDEAAEDHFIVMSDIVNVANGKVTFDAWNGGEVKTYTSSDADIVKGGIYTFTMSADGTVTDAVEVTGTEGILTHLADLVLRVGVAGSTEGTVISYNKDTVAFVIDLESGSVEAAELSELSTTAADAVEEMEAGTVDTLVIVDGNNVATHIYRFAE